MIGFAFVGHAGHFRYYLCRLVALIIVVIHPNLDETIISISSQDLDDRSGLPLAPNRKIGKNDPVPLLAVQALEVAAIQFLSWGAGSGFFATVLAVQWQVSLVLVSAFLCQCHG